MAAHRASAAPYPTTGRIGRHQVLPTINPTDYVSPSAYAAQRMGGKAGSVRREHEVPQIVEFMDMRELSYNKTSKLSIDQPLFLASPSEVTFQNFVPLQEYEVAVVFRNADTVPRRLKVLHSNTPYFEVIAPDSAGINVASGMDLVYKVIFRPDEARDYTDEMVCITEREKFIVPIRAIGLRALLDFPDVVDFGESAVKHSTTKVLLVRNIGDAPARFSVECDGPFRLTPSEGEVATGGSLQVVCHFEPVTLGDHSGSMVVSYDTGEAVAIQMLGRAEDIAVRLEKNSIRAESTCITHASQKVFRIQNRSDIMVKFCWKAMATIEEEQQMLARRTEEIDARETVETDEFAQMLESDPLQRTQAAVLRRTFDVLRQTAADASNAYADDIFRIEPCEGEIWPQSEAVITVIFTPKEATSYSRNVYCDVTGRETRLPLKLRGEGLGPSLEFRPAAVDMGRVFVGSTHVYEVVARNMSNIDAPFKFEELESTTHFGRALTVSPKEGVVLPGEHQAFSVVFTSDVVGTVDDTISLHVAGAAENSYPSVRFFGSVIAPTFRFSSEEFDFGVIPFGFPSAQRHTLTNTSLVPIDVELRRPNEYPEAADLVINPQRVMVPPGESVEVEATLTPTRCGIFDLFVSVDIIGVASALLTIPVCANAFTPEGITATEVVDFKRCFLGTTSTAVVILENTTHMPGHFEYVPDESNSPMSFHVIEPTGIVAAASQTKITVKMTPNVVGELTSVLRFRILGDNDTVLQVACGCICEGPVVSVLPQALKWGKQRMLMDVPMTLCVTNESTIPADVTCTFDEHLGSIFRCAPTHLILAPGKSAEVTVTANFNDTSDYSGNLVLSVADGCDVEVALRGKGTGSPLITNPDIDSTIDFMHQFSKRECVKTIEVTNGSARAQTFHFSLDSPPPGVSGLCTIMRGATFHKKRTPACPNPPDPSLSHFGVWPEKVFLASGESTTIELRGLSNSVCKVDETILCHSSFEGSTSQRLVATCNVRADFISPLVERSPDAITFEFTKSTDVEKLDVEVKEIALRNTGELPVTMALNCSGPFSITEKSAMTLNPGEIYAVPVTYDPNHIDLLHSRTDRGMLVVKFTEHPLVEEIPLTAVVHFPNLKVSATEINFGSVLLDTFVVRDVAMTNTSPIPVTYNWAFECNQNNVHDYDQIFDVVPSSGVLDVGQSEIVQFFFHGYGTHATACTAICEILDGPEYEVKLIGEASREKVHFSSTEYNLGAVDFTETTEVNLVITNQCSLELPFGLERKGDSASTLKISHPTGVLSPYGSANISVSCSPNEPGDIDEHLECRIGHMDPQLVRIRGVSTFPCVRVLDALRLDGSSPKDNEDLTVEAKAIRERAHATIANPGQKFGQLILAEYVIDFGAVKREVVLTKTLNIANIGSKTVSLKLNKKKLEGGYFKPFTVPCESIAELAVNNTDQVEVTFCSKSTRRVDFELGRVERVLVLQLDGGSQIRVHLRAQVCAPEVSFTTTTLDFGRVKYGDASTHYIQAVNTSSVPCSWALPSGVSKERPFGMPKQLIATLDSRMHEESCFEVAPRKGVLGPGDRCTISVRFVPDHGKKKFSAGLPIVIDGSKDTRILELTGNCLEPELHFSISEFTVGPTYPNDKPVDTTVTVTNSSDFDVEIFSVDFDRQHQKEEAALSALDVWKNGRVLLPQRAAGEPLPEEIFRWADLKDQADRLRPNPGIRIESMDGVDAEMEDKEWAELADKLSFDPIQAANDRSTGEDLRRAAYALDHGGFNAIVYGRVGSDAVSCSLSWAQQYGAKHVTLGEMIEDAVQNRTLAGVEVATIFLSCQLRELFTAFCRSLHADTTKVSASREEVASSLDWAKLAAILRSAGCLSKWLCAPVDGSEADDVQEKIDIKKICTLADKDHNNKIVLDEFVSVFVRPSSPRGNDITVEDGLGAEATEVVGPLAAGDVAIFPDRAELSSELMVRIFSDCAMTALDGIVVSGLETFKYGKPTAVLPALLKVLGPRNSLYVIHVQASSEFCNKRTKPTESADVVPKPPYKILTPEQFLDLSETAKQEYRTQEAAFKAELRAATTRQLQKQEDFVKSQMEDKEVESKNIRVKSRAANKGKLSKEVAQNDAALSQFNSTRNNVFDMVHMLQKCADAPWNESLLQTSTLEDGDESRDTSFDHLNHDVTQILKVWDTKKGDMSGPLEEDTHKGKKGHDSARGARKSVEHKEGGGDDAGDDPAEEPRRVELIVIDNESMELATVDQLNTHNQIISVADVQKRLRINGRSDPDYIPEHVQQSAVRYPKTRPDCAIINTFRFFEPTPVIAQEDDGVASEATTAQSQVEESAHKTRRKSPSRAGSGKRDLASSKGKRSSSSKKVSSADPVDDVVSEPVDEILKTPRWIIPAKSETSIHIRFASTTCGTFKNDLRFESVGSGAQYSIHATGVAAFPSVECVGGHERIEFGAVIAQKHVDLTLTNSPHVKQLEFRNTSWGQEVEVRAGLVKEHASKCFRITPSNLLIAPGESGAINIAAFPQDTNVSRDTLLVCVRGNPVALTLPIECEGAKPDIDVGDGNLVFERVLVRRKTTQHLCVQNKSKLPVAWSLAKAIDALGEDFKCPVLSGIIPPEQVEKISFQFLAKKVGAQKKSIKIEFGDSAENLNASETISVVAEAYSVEMDLKFGDKKTDNFLDFGTTRVGDEHTLMCHLRNKGKYELRYNFTVDHKLLKKSVNNKQNLKRMFEIFPTSGILGHTDKDKIAQVKFVFKPTAAMTIEDEDLILCEVSDPHMQETVIKVPIPVSACALYSSYEIIPERGLHFGAKEFGTEKFQRELTIKNTGPLELRYRITKVMQKAPAVPSATKVTGRMSRRTNSSMQPARASVQPAVPLENSLRKFSVGCFNLSCGGGTIPPNSVTKVVVEAAPVKATPDKQYIVIDVEQRMPGLDPDGVQYPLTIEPTQPVIATNPNNIFGELQILPTAPSIVTTPTFIIDSGTLDFGHAVVGSPIEAHVRVLNPGSIPCTVQLSVSVSQRPGTSKKGDDVQSSGFTIEPSKLTIQSHDTAVAVVCFTPTMCTSFDGSIEACVLPSSERLATDYPGSSFKYGLAGRGALPTVRLLSPKEKRADGAALLRFNRTRTGEARLMPVKVLNPGPLPAHVVLKIVQDGDGPARAVSRSGSRAASPSSRNRGGPSANRKSKSRHGPDASASATTIASAKNRKAASAPSENIDHLPIESQGSLVDTAGAFTCVGTGLAQLIQPGESRDLMVKYTPLDASVHNCTIRVCVMDNIFEASFVECTGEGHNDSVSLELDSGAEVLEFGDVALGEKVDRTFLVSNSADIPQRFEFPQHDDFEFSPRVGLLEGKSSKSITCTFEPHSAQKYEAKQFTCTFEEVALVNEDDVNWDDSLRTVRWQIMEGAQGSLQRVKVLEVVPEPEFEKISGSERTLTLTASAVSGYCEFTLTDPEGSDLGDILFQETLMYQTRTFSLQLKNTGAVRCPFSFEIANDNMSPEDENYMPFSAVPAQGEVASGDTMIVNISYHPTDVGITEALLTCLVPNRPAEAEAVAIDVSGSAIRPVCHIDLPASTYLQQDRSRMKGASGELGEIDPNTKVVEIQCSGVTVSQTASFDVINPTAKDLKFKWTAVSADPNFVSSRRGAVTTAGLFKCLTSVGVIHSGNRRAMTFEYCPSSLELREMFWRFDIESEKVSVPFVVVGRAREPKVTFTSRFLNLVPLLVGETTTETVHLRNDEDTPQEFRFGKRAFEDINKAAVVSVTPSEGKVKPRSSLPVTVKFTPKLVQPYNFQLFCKIKNKEARECLTVKCLAHTIDCTLSSMPKSDPMSSSSATAVDLGTISAFDWVARTFELTNHGELPIECKWKNDTRKGQLFLSVSPPMAFVGSSETVRFEVKFSPNSHKNTDLSDVMLRCCVTNGPTYPIRVSAKALLPRLEWSVKEHDFGDAFVWQQNMPPEKVKLVVVNNEPTASVSIVSLHKTTPWLEVSFGNVVLEPGERCEIFVFFTPRDSVSFKDNAVFEINGKQRVTIPFQGRGVPLDLSLEKDTDRKVSLGPIVVGSVLKKTVNLVNRSRLPLTFTLSKTTSPPGSEALSFKPSGVVKELPPNGVCPIDLTFAPTKRIPSFTETFSFFTMGIDRELMVVKAACHAVKVELDNQQIFFPLTTLNGSVSRRVMLHNCGDIGTKFEWRTSKQLLKWFSIVPERGYVAPGAEMVFVVTFHPQVAAEGEIRFEGIECSVEGLKEALRLDVTALGAVASQVEKEVLTFTTAVRTGETKAIKISNTSTEWWHLHPMFDNDLFTGESKVSIPPGGSTFYDVNYHPVSMTAGRNGPAGGSSRDAIVRDVVENLNKSHNATLFIALPDGTSTVYSLVGFATPPKPISLPAEEVPCQMLYRKSLPVCNWLQQSQRFRAIIKCGDKKSDLATELKPAVGDTIDVPGGMTRDFFIDFFAFRENMTVQASVTFRNEDTQEFIAYELTFKTTSAGVLDTVQLSAAVRTRAIHKVTLRNPLPHTVTFNMACIELGGQAGQRNVPCTDIRGPSQIKVAGKSVDSFEFEFLPLFVREKQAQLTLSSAELGTNTYLLSLLSTEPAPVPEEVFSTPLGSTETRIIKVLNMAPSRGERAKYKIAISSDAFKTKVPGDLVSPGNDNMVKIPIIFEPAQLGVTKATLTLSSATGGQFDIPLTGECLNPVPAGPFTIKSGGRVSIPFKNVQDTACKYIYTLSNDQFSAKDSEDWKPKEEKDIVVKYDGNRDPTIRTARLLVRCASGLCAGAEWNFYLKGTPA